MNPDREIVPEVRPEAEPTEPDANLQKSNKGLILDGNVMIERRGQSSLTEMLPALVSRTAPVPSLVIRLPSRMSVSTILRRVRAGPGSRRSLL